MTGTFLNIATVLVGGVIGLIFGARIPEKLKGTVIAGMGLFTAAMGIQMFLNTENPLIVLGSLLIGTLLGEWWRIEDGLQNLGKYLEQTILQFRRRWLEQIRARIPDRLAFVLCGTDDDPRLDPGWIDRRLQPAGGQIRAGRVRLAGVRIHAGWG
jgi:hypothetical protein